MLTTLGTKLHIFNAPLLFLINLSVKEIFNSIRSKITKRNAHEPAKARGRPLETIGTVRNSYKHILIYLIKPLESQMSTHQILNRLFGPLV